LLLALALFVAAQSPPPDSSAFSDVRTATLIGFAIERHHAPDEAVQDYTAKFRYRLSFGLGRRRWARVANAAVEEQEGRVQWSAPNDLRVDILGRRSTARSASLQLSSDFDRPWFIPRALPDSIRVFGNEIPPQAALHPLAVDGPDWYHYRLTDSVRITTPSGRRVKLLGVEVLPRRPGSSLVSGRLWLDEESHDLVRFSFRFVGTELWLDREDKDPEISARRVNDIVSRVLTLDADLEYALQEDRSWMPYRQVVSGRVELPWFGELVIPFQATTTFDEYELNTGHPVAFTVPLPPEVTDPDSVRALRLAQRDSLRAERRRRRANGETPDGEARDDAGRWNGGRFEIHRPPSDSLKAYAGWDDSLVLEDDPAADQEVTQVQVDLERLSVGLPSELTGRSTHGFTWERLIDFLRYNRVQGLAPGLGYHFQLPGDGFTTARVEARFGLSDHRLTGGLTLLREAPGARWTFSAYHDLRSSDPFGKGNGFGNSLNALFVGHDDADYQLVNGVRLNREASLGVGTELTTAVLLEQQRSVRREAKSWLNDALGGTGVFPANPPIVEGTFGGGVVRLDHGGLRSRWSLGADILGNGHRTTARGFGWYRLPLWSGSAAPAIVLRAGITTSSPLPQQLFRIGGGETVRGFDYGARRGQAFWAAQLDWPLRRGLIQPVVFADAGQAADASSLFRSRAIAGAGGGLALLGGLLRFDLSHPIRRGGSGLRFDLRVRNLF
jgi:hypothetical protein